MTKLFQYGRSGVCVFCQKSAHSAMKSNHDDMIKAKAGKSFLVNIDKIA